MPTHDVTVECPVPSSFAVDQVRGMFDLAAADHARETFNVELPADDENWRIGVIVGPSGSGKTTVAREAYGDRFVEGGFRWEKGKAVVDHFGKLSMKMVTQTLTSVGFSSPPAWVKPHHVLSGGERFRCDLARALLRPGELVAFDEFTSVVDRNVARIGSAAVAKSIRQGRIGKKFVAVTCHYDVLDWLEPDWVLDMASCQLARGCLYRRPQIELTVAPVHRGAWQLFRRHHYLNHELSNAARCFAVFWGDEPVALSAWIHRMTRGAIVAVGELVECLPIERVRRATPLFTTRVSIDALPGGLGWVVNHPHTEGPWCWVLSNVRRLAEPIACSGRQGLWTPAADLRELCASA